MSSIELSQISGLAKNVARVKRVEDRWREKAFLPELERINGVKVLQLTLAHVQELERVKSPFLMVGMGTQPEDVGLFLWIVHPYYDRYNSELRVQFLEQLMLEYAAPDRPRKEKSFHLFYRCIYRYLWIRALMDLPPQATSGIRVGTCTSASVINKIAGAYGWITERIISEPMAALYQYIKWIDLDPDIPQFHPLQDRMKAYYGSRD